MLLLWCVDAARVCASLVTVCMCRKESAAKKKKKKKKKEITKSIISSKTSFTKNSNLSFSFSLLIALSLLVPGASASTVDGRA